MSVTQTVTVKIDNKDNQEQKQKQDASTDDSRGGGSDVSPVTVEDVKPKATKK